MEPKFKVGDRVISTPGFDSTFSPAGTTGTIVKILNKHIVPYYILWDVSERILPRQEDQFRSAIPEINEAKLKKALNL